MYKRQIRGTNLRTAVQGFLLQHLGFDDTFVNGMGPLSVTRIERRRPAGNIADEAVVTFHTKEIRDTVRGAAFKLGACALTAGIRLEVPDFLQNNFKALENIAFRLKKKYGGLKRNIKLDDYRMDVVMDVKLDKTSEWNTILPQHAIRAKQNLKPDQPSGASRTLDQNELDDLMAESEEDDQME